MNAIIASLVAALASLGIAVPANVSDNITQVASSSVSPAQQAPKSNNQRPANNSTTISRQQALDISYRHAGITASQVTHYDDVELDSDDGRRVWEIEYKTGRMEHEFDIDARSGRVLNYERDWDD